MSIDKRRLAWSLAGALAWVAPDIGAVRLGPPSEALVKEPHLVVAVEAREVLDGGRVAFERREVLLGEGVPERIEVRFEEEVPAVEPGGRYVLGYQTLRRVADSRTLYEDDPEGPSVVRLPVLGDALLEDSPEIRRIVLSAAGDEKATARELLDAVVRQLPRPQVVSLRFVAAELLFRPELQELAGPKEVQVIRERLPTLASDPFSRDLLLQAASTFALVEGGGWLAEESRSVLSSYGTELDLSSGVPSLLVTAAKALAKTGKAADVPLLERHLFSNNPGVAKASLKAMDALDRTAAVAAVKKALAKDGLHAESRRALEAYLSRSVPRPLQGSSVS